MRYHSIIAIQNTIEWNITNDPAYDFWVNNEKQAARFLAAKTALSESIDADRNHRFFLTNDIESVRAKLTDNFDAYLAKFTGQAVMTAIQGLEREQTRFNAMHLANSADA